MNGFVSSKVELKPGKYGFGLFVKSDVKKGEVLLDIPHESAFRYPFWGTATQKTSKIISSAKSKSELGLDNVTDELTESDLLAVNLLNQIRSGQTKNYFEKMNLYELPFEWDSDEVNCLPVQCRRNGLYCIIYTFYLTIELDFVRDRA